MKLEAPNEFQRAVLDVPEEYNLLLEGGRGGGKSVALLQLVLRHVEQRGEFARPLIVRETHKALMELEQNLDSMLVTAYGRRGARHNAQDHVWRLGNGAIIEAGQLETHKDVTKYIGRSNTMLVVDEYGHIANPKWVNMLRSNMRSSGDFPLRELRAANPGGNGHQHIYSNFILAGPPWAPMTVDEKRWVRCPSTYHNNPYVKDQDEYRRTLASSVGSDMELLKAWESGEWNIAKGAMFGNVFDPNVHVLEEFPWSPRHFECFLALDWGSSAPAVVFLVLRARGCIGPFPKGSIILLDELATNIPGDLNEGLRWPPGKLVDAIQEVVRRWELTGLRGVGDDSYGIDDNLLSVFARLGLVLQRPEKGPGSRVSGWNAIKQMLHNVKERNGRAGLWMTRRCKYLLATLPFISRDPLKPEDIVSDGPDHGCDALRYAVTYTPMGFSMGRISGLT